ncbi:hypothetical protein DM02DRAFT_167683 [Periconia macrospinosa]|uniref:STEEP1 domain-containing protein n=1 Tax=Periconia macrospinosa TaxID=97972 RepID=A0A2V1E2B6_9PLEO|nr:hypothetical protein DM02DRAFT_167683 [Periconia macrospinosa]
MDITQTSRAYFAMPSPTPSEKISLAASSTVYTYHCLCTHLLLATSTPLSSLPTRKHSQDQACIMPLPPPPAPAPTTKRRASREEDSTPVNDHYGLLLSTRLDAHAEMVTSDEGFEKRYLQRCGRCALIVGYQLDWAQFTSSTDARTGRRDDVVYLLPGGFVSTSEMVMGKAASKAAAAVGDKGKSGAAGGIEMVSVSEVKV